MADMRDIAGMIRELRDENAKLQSELDRRDTWYRAVIDEECEQDERHCSCVPTLRKEIERLRADIDSVVLCRMCHEPDADCHCAHTTTDSWMALRESVAFVSDEVERLRAEIARLSRECEAASDIQAKLQDEIASRRDENDRICREREAYRIAGTNLYQTAMEEYHDEIEDWDRSLEDIDEEATRILNEEMGAEEAGGEDV